MFSLLPRCQGVSHETIYQALYVQGRGHLRADLHKQLRTGRAVRRPRGSATAGKATLTNVVSISERPAEADDRAVPGHWEGDLILGSNCRSAIGTLVERSTRFVLLVHLPGGHSAPAVRDAMIPTISTLPQQLRRSLAWDRGTELARHRDITMATGLDIYFCDPHSPHLHLPDVRAGELVTDLLRAPLQVHLGVHERRQRPVLELARLGPPPPQLGALVRRIRRVDRQRPALPWRCGGALVAGELAADRRRRPPELGGDGAHACASPTQIRDRKPLLQRQEPPGHHPRRQRYAAAGGLAPSITLSSFHADSLTRSRVGLALPDQLPESGLPLHLLLLPRRHDQHLHDQAVLRRPSETGLPQTVVAARRRSQGWRVYVRPLSSTVSSGLPLSWKPARRATAALARLSGSISSQSTGVASTRRA